MWEELDGPLDEYLWYHIRGVQGKTGGKNLEKRLEKADQKYGTVLTMLILTAVINDDPDAYQSLYDEEAMETMLRRGKRNYDANQK